MRKRKTMKSEAQTTNVIEAQPSGLGMNGAALAHALNLLAKAGYPATVTDTSEGLSILLPGLQTRPSGSGRLAFAVADTSAEKK